MLGAAIKTHADIQDDGSNAGFPRLLRPNKARPAF
jgi:hypothetical protein